MTQSGMHVTFTVFFASSMAHTRRKQPSRKHTSSSVRRRLRKAKKTANVICLDDQGNDTDCTIPHFQRVDVLKSRSTKWIRVSDRWAYTAREAIDGLGDVNASEGNTFDDTVVNEVHDLGDLDDCNGRKVYENSVRTQFLLFTCRKLILLLIQRRPLHTWRGELGTVGYRELYLHELLRMEGRGDYTNSMTCPNCDNPTSEWFKCCDCFGGVLECQGCILSSHRRNPLHHVEVRSFPHGVLYIDIL